MSKRVYFPFKMLSGFWKPKLFLWYCSSLYLCCTNVLFKKLCLHLYFSGMSRSGALQMLHNGTFAGINRDGERGPSYFSSSFFLYCLLTRTGDSMRILDTLCCNVEYWVLANNQKPNITCEVLGRFPRIWGFYIFRKICRNRYVQYKSFTSSSSKTKKTEWNEEGSWNRK